MKRPRWTLTPFVLFLVLLIGGIALTTILFKVAQRTGGGHAADATEAQKLYLEARTGTSQLLFNLAFASIGGLMALQFAGGERVTFSPRGFFSACALLLVSIYSAFLFQVGLSISLEGPLNVMFGPILAYPIVCQFWTLFAAIVVVASTLARGAKGAPAAAVVLLLAVPADAAPAPTYKQCVTAWAAERAIVLPAEGVREGAKLVETLVWRREVVVAAGERCTIAAAMLDRVRFVAIESGKPVSGKEAGVALAAMLKDARIAADAPNLSPGELMDKLLGIAEFWREPAAILELSAPRPLFVSVIEVGRSAATEEKGYTKFVVRLQPGHYSVSAADGGRLVYSGMIELADGQRRQMELGSATR